MTVLPCGIAALQSMRGDALQPRWLHSEAVALCLGPDEHPVETQRPPPVLDAPDDGIAGFPALGTSRAVAEIEEPLMQRKHRAAGPISAEARLLGSSKARVDPGIVSAAASMSDPSPCRAFDAKNDTARPMDSLRHDLQGQQGNAFASEPVSPTRTSDTVQSQAHDDAGRAAGVAQLPDPTLFIPAKRSGALRPPASRLSGPAIVS